MKSLSRVRLFGTPWTVVHQVPPSVGFPRQEYWSGLPFPSPGDLPDPGIEPMSPAFPALAGRFFTLCHLGSPHKMVQFSCSVMSNSLQVHRLQHTRFPLSITNSQSLLKLMSIESVMPSNHLILCGPLLPLPSIFPSIMVFSNESVLHIRWPKYWSFCREPA